MLTHDTTHINRFTSEGQLQMVMFLIGCTDSRGSADATTAPAPPRRSRTLLQSLGLMERLRLLMIRLGILLERIK
jgi:hypothetical protein